MQCNTCDNPPIVHLRHKSLALTDPASSAAETWAPTATMDARTQHVVIGDGGWRLWLDAPQDEAPPDGFPTLWVLDGGSLFPIVSAVARRLAKRPAATGVGPMVVVGLDHDPIDAGRRYADYTPGPSEHPDEAAQGRAFGGADRLLNVLTGQARAAVEATAPLNPARHFLLGHSLSGLFALHAMTTRPQAFAAFGAMSPSIWWSSADTQARLKAMEDRGQRLFIGAGEREESPATDARRVSRRMVANARAAAKLAADRLGPDQVEFVIALDEDHASALVALMPRFLRFVGQTGVAAALSA